MNHGTVKAAATTERGLGWLYDQVTGDEDARVCKDISDSACRHQPRNFFAYLSANVLSKIADELSSARLMLPWMLGALGAPAAFAGFLVPIREAGVLLPQLLVAAWIRRLPIRKTVWITGAVLSALALLLMAWSVDRYTGVSAGWIVLAALTIYSLARGLCSVAAKDVLGKTVSKMRRGVLMGIAAGIAGVATLLIGLYIRFFVTDSAGTAVFFVFLVAAALLWLVAVALFALIREIPGASEGGGNALVEAVASLALLKTDRLFRQFVLARSLLLSLALVLPFYVLLVQSHADNIAGLGMLIIANGAAASLSSPFWGRMSDRSSRRVMSLAALAGGSVCILVFLLARFWPGPLSLPWAQALLYFLIAVAYHGVRLGRKVYLVDMSGTDKRASYVAVSNTVIGVAMLAGGAFGFLADMLDTATVIGLFGLLAVFAALYSRRLQEVSG